MVSFGHVLHFRYYQNEISKKVKMAPLGCWLTSFVWLWYGTMGLRTLWSRIDLLKFDKLLWKLPTDTKLSITVAHFCTFMFVSICTLYCISLRRCWKPGFDPSLLPKTLWLIFMKIILKNWVFQNHQFSIYFHQNFRDWSLGS